MEKRLREWIEKERQKLKRKREESDYLPERYYLWGRLEALDSLEDWLKKNIEKTQKNKTPGSCPGEKEAH